MRFLTQQLHREFVLALRQWGGLIQASLFFLLFMAFFPLTLQPDKAMLRTLLPGLLWIAELLSLMLSTDRLFKDDYDHGVVEQWLVSGNSLVLWISIKVLVNWFSGLLPVLCLAPLLAMMYSLSLHELFILWASLACGTLALFYLCTLISVLGLHIQQQVALIALLVFPLTLPVLILGSGGLSLAMQGFSAQPYLLLLSALSLITVALLPLTISAIFKINP